MWGHHEDRGTTWGQGGHQKNLRTSSRCKIGTSWGHHRDRGHVDVLGTVQGHPGDRATMSRPPWGYLGDRRPPQGYQRDRAHGDILGTLWGQGTWSPCHRHHRDILETGRHPEDTRGMGHMGTSWGHCGDRGRGHHVTATMGMPWGQGHRVPKGRGHGPQGTQAHGLTSSRGCSPSGSAPWSWPRLLSASSSASRAWPRLFSASSSTSRPWPRLLSASSSASRAWPRLFSASSSASRSWPRLFSASSSASRGLPKGT